MFQLKNLFIAIFALSIFACGSENTTNSTTTPEATKAPLTKEEEQPISQQAKDLMEKSNQALNQEKSNLINGLPNSINKTNARMEVKDPVAAATRPSSSVDTDKATAKKAVLKTEEKAKAVVHEKATAVKKTVANEAKTIPTKTTKPVAVEEPVVGTATSTSVTQPKEVVKKTKEVVKEIIDIKVDHSPFDALLKKYVSASGKVNYKGIKSDQAKLDAYLKTLSERPVRSEWTKSETMAYWINMYNAFTIKLIVDNYPVKSIMDLEGGKPWDKKWIKIGSETYSLNHIENKILRPQFKEAAIHFAVNCAAKSCPPLLNRAWTAANLKSNFKKQATAFINNPSFNKITDGKVEVSKIFDWYKEDFGELTTYLNRYSKTKINAGTTIEYLEYDWQLNE